MVRKLIDLFKEISRPQENYNGGEKVDVIKNILSEKGFKSFYMSGIGLVVPKENPRIILVSHLDLIGTFNKVFKDGLPPFVFTKNQETEEQYIKGALDNTVTNAAALLAFFEHNDDIELLLSEGEETGLFGVRNYCKTFAEKAEKAFFINLDVTNEGWDSYCSVEYDKPSFDILKQCQKLLNNGFFTGDRFCDDTDAVLTAGYDGFSYCLPTKGMIHSMENKAKISSLDPYVKGLVSLLKNLVIEDMSNHMDKRVFDKALTSDTEPAAPAFQSKFNSREQSEKLDEFIESTVDFAETAFNLSVVEGVQFEAKFKRLIISQEVFSIKEFTKDFENKARISELIEHLTEYGALEEVEHGKYKFPSPAEISMMNDLYGWC